MALRVNPDVDAGTHAKITTGRAENKFGIPYADAAALYARAASLPGVRPVGLALHIGSQIVTLAPYRAAFARAAALVRDLRGAGLAVSRMDCGGGFGIGYRDEPGAAPEALRRRAAGGVRRAGPRADGRAGALAGRAGRRAARQCAADQGGGPLRRARRRHERPGAAGDVRRLARRSCRCRRCDATEAAAPVDLVGPVCETARHLRPRPRCCRGCAPGDRVALLDAGAYGAVMSSTYNARPLAPIALIDGARWATIRPRQTHRGTLGRRERTRLPGLMRAAAGNTTR